MKAFQALTLTATGRIDRLITDIEVCPAFEQANPPNPLPAKTATKALWDTGASRSVVSGDFVQRLGLVPTGVTEVHHGDGSSIRSTYLINFYLPNGVCLQGITATEFPASHSHFCVLVGMDVICEGDFSITNVHGQTTMSFRIPSCEVIDYVSVANKMIYAGVNRNAPCPCGKIGPTGAVLKFKLCHGK